MSFFRGFGRTFDANAWRRGLDQKKSREFAERQAAQQQEAIMARFAASHGLAQERFNALQSQRAGDNAFRDQNFQANQAHRSALLDHNKTKLRTDNAFRLSKGLPDAASQAAGFELFRGGADPGDSETAQTLQQLTDEANRRARLHQSRAAFNNARSAGRAANRNLADRRLAEHAGTGKPAPQAANDPRLGTTSPIAPALAKPGKGSSSKLPPDIKGAQKPIDDLENTLAQSKISGKRLGFDAPGTVPGVIMRALSSVQDPSKLRINKEFLQMTYASQKSNPEAESRIVAYVVQKIAQKQPGIDPLKAAQQARAMLEQ